MSAKLLTYEYVPLGFEVVIKNTDIEMGKIWNLWHNVKLTDDPESWDSEIKAINKMQDRLGELSVDQRLIRAQMAEFCRMHPLFPKSIDILCKEIEEDRFSKPVKIGCEGRGLLDSLGYHDYRSLDDQRKETLTEYAWSLKKWLAQGQPETATATKIFGFLGQLTDSKRALVQRLVHVVDLDKPSVSSLRRLTEGICRETYIDVATRACERYLGRPFNCFKCLSKEVSTPRCECCYSMFLDACLLCAGTFGEKRSMFDEFRRFIEENILAYSVAINSWLTETPPKHITWLENARYLSKDSVLEIAEKVHSSLGEKNGVKEWLTACLLKTIKENQRWHKRTELIDNFPEATSWFRGIL